MLDNEVVKSVISLVDGTVLPQKEGVVLIDEICFTLSVRSDANSATVTELCETLKAIQNQKNQALTLQTGQPQDM